MKKQALLIFAKNVIFGKVKTRLAASIGNDLAMAVYNQLLGHTQSITDFLPIDKILFYSEYIDEQDLWDKEHYEKQIQSGNDLGDRMKKAFSLIFNRGYEKAVIIGTDCLELTSGIVMNSFAYLNNHDVVIGPAIDGGYYLLGMKTFYPELFENIDWSTDKVLKQTLAVCKQQHLSIHCLPELNDIDDENDWRNIKSQLIAKGLRHD